MVHLLGGGRVHITQQISFYYHIQENKYHAYKDSQKLSQDLNLCGAFVESATNFVLSSAISLLGLWVVERTTMCVRDRSMSMYATEIVSE